MTLTTSNPAYRPQYEQQVRLVRLAMAHPCDPTPQAAVGDVVRVIRTRTPPDDWHGGEKGCLWIQHWGGENCEGHMRDYGHHCGTVGVWEMVESNA